MLIHRYDIRVIHAASGEILGRLTINPERRYHAPANPSADHHARTAYRTTKNKKPDP